MKRNGRVTLAGASLILMLVSAGCGAGPGDDTPATPTPSPTSEPSLSEPSLSDTPSDRPTATPSNGADEPEVQAAVQDLATRLGVEVADIAVGPLEEVTWPDGSIGCPQPGQMYTQALVDGTRLILVVDGTDYDYHAGGGQALTYCAIPSDPVGGGATA